MKLCAKFSLFIVVLLLVALVTPGHCVTEPAIRRAGLVHQAETFDQLLKQTVVTLDTSHAITASNNTATGTESVYFMPDSGDFDYPVEVRVQNHGTASITYVPYSVTTASGVALPTATASHLLTPQGEAVVSGKAYRGVFYQLPNISIGASGNQEVIIEVWGRKNTE